MDRENGRGARKPLQDGRSLRFLSGVLAFAAVAMAVGWFLLVSRPADREQALTRFLRVDAERDCCYAGSVAGEPACIDALRDVVDLNAVHDRAIDWPEHTPDLVRDAVHLALGVDDAAVRAAGVYRHCPAAQELARISSTGPIERMCGVTATPEERDQLAARAARDGLLVPALTLGNCTDAGYDAGLKQIQLEFSDLCSHDACLEALLQAPLSSRSRVRDIAAAHPNEVLVALAPRLGPGQKPRAVELLTLLLGQDTRAIAALSRGDLGGLDLESASDLLELPLNPRKIYLLRHIQGHVPGAASAVAAVFLDAADASLASELQLREGLLELQGHKCALVERAVQRLDLGAPARADAALPALIGCPKAAQLVLGDGDRLALTERVLEAALRGQLGNVDELLADRLDRSTVADLQVLMAMGAKEELADAAARVREMLRRVLEERLRALEPPVVAGASGEGAVEPTP